MFKEKLFATRRAGLLQWALNGHRADWQVADNLFELTAKIAAGKDNAILVAIKTNAYSVSIPAYGDVSGYDLYDITFNGSNGQVDAYQLTRFKKNQLYASYMIEDGHNEPSNNIIESKNGGNLSLPPDSAINKYLSRLFEAIGKARAEPTTMLDWLGGERKLKLAANIRA